MGGGGTTGTVAFPPYIEDVHGQLFAGVGVDSAKGGGFWDDSWHRTELSVVSIMNTLWSSTPYSSFSWTDPSTDLTASKSQFTLAYSAVTAVDRGKYSDYIADAILAIGNSTTVPIEDLVPALNLAGLSTPQQLYGTYAGLARISAASNLTAMIAAVQSDVQALVPDAASVAAASVSLTAATTLWLSVITTAKQELARCNMPKDANLLSILTKAAQDAEANLRNALLVAENFVNEGLLSDMIQAFRNRTEITFSRQHRQFSGQMADINAINSTGFLFGSAILKAEQMREVSEFDASLSLTQFRQGVASYMEMHKNALTAGLAIEQQNAQAYNRLLEVSIDLLTQLAIRGEIVGKDLIPLYGQFFNAELAMFDTEFRDQVGTQSGVYGDLTRLSTDAARINKIAKEQRFAIGMLDVQRMITSRAEFERTAAELLTDQNRIKILATHEYDSKVNETSVESTLWNLSVARGGADILVAPGGMASAIPKTNVNPARSALGGALKGAGAGFILGGPPGAAIGAISGGIAGLIGAT